jgi:hypothetical protein
MADDLPFLSLQHAATKRWAVFEDDGDSAWLYVTEPETQKPVGDCLVYNRAAPEEAISKWLSRSRPPPITKAFASSVAHRPRITADHLKVAWARGGDATAVFLDDKPLAFLVVGEKRGYSCAIAVDGPWGHPWDDTRFAEFFGEHLD